MFMNVSTYFNEYKQKKNYKSLSWLHAVLLNKNNDDT